MNEATNKTQAQRTMLIVDDQQSVRVTLEYLLELDGYRVLLADSGLAAVAIAEREPIDGALIDIHMPVTDGFAICAQLQAVAATRGRPLRVWFMSGAFSGALKRRSFELGSMGIFSKPFDPVTLSKKLEEDFLPSAPQVLFTAAVTSAADDSDADAQT